MSKLDKDKYIKYLEKRLMNDAYGEYNSARIINDTTDSVTKILDSDFCDKDNKALDIYSRLSREYYINRNTMSEDEFSEWREKCENDSREYDEKELINEEEK